MTRVKIASSDSPLFARLPVEPIACADAMAWLSTLPDGYANLVLTDCAYESLEKHRARGTTTRLAHSKASSNDWFPIFPNARFPSLFAELWRVLAPNSHLYWYCDEETMWATRAPAEAAGFRYWKSLVWDKKTIGMGYHYRNRTERIMFFEKGKRKLNDLGISDVIECKRIVGGYPTEKPPEVAKVLISQSTVAGELVLDPFMGSGSTLVAAKDLGRRFAGCDIQQAAVDLARSRCASTPADEAEGARAVDRIGAAAGALDEA